MRDLRFVFALCGSVMICLSPANARDVKIKGTYNSSEIGVKCANNNGTFTNLPGGGYGCVGSGGTVTCTAKGRCKGWVPLLADNGGKNNPTKPTKVEGGGASTTHKPVNVGINNPPTQVNSPVTNGRGGGMGQGGHR